MKKDYSGDKCKCGHQRNSHGRSDSINYTEGACFVGTCKCKHFMFDDSVGKNTQNCNVCRSCGIAANVLVCLQRYGRSPKELAFSVSTFHEGKCGICGDTCPVTEQRDFFYPDFSLIDKVVEFLQADVPPELPPGDGRRAGWFD